MKRRHPKVEHPTALKAFTDAELIEELARRTRTRDKEREKSWCDDCANFKPWNGLDGMPENYNPCSKGHEMKFQEPVDYSDAIGWGFYRLVCADRTEIGEAR